jgi:hypothetical protein
MAKKATPIRATKVDETDKALAPEAALVEVAEAAPEVTIVAVPAEVAEAAVDAAEAGADEAPDDGVTDALARVVAAAPLCG